MASVYLRGSRFWMRVKDEHGQWLSRATPFAAGAESDAQQYALTAQLAFERRKSAGVRIGRMTVLQRKANLVSTKTGYVYAVALIPELVPWRIKVGFSRDVEERLKVYRTCCPTARPIGAWDADPIDEARVHRKLRGRIGDSEVFITRDPEDLLLTIDNVLAVEAFE